MGSIMELLSVFAKSPLKQKLILIRPKLKTSFIKIINILRSIEIQKMKISSEQRYVAFRKLIYNTFVAVC